MTAPTPVLEPSERPDRARRGDRRGGRRGTAVFISAVILLVLALGTVGAAFVVRHDTSDLRAQAGPVREEVRKLAATEKDAARRLRLLRARSRATKEALAALFAAELAQVDASNHAVDVANQAADRYNNAQAAGLAAAFQGAGAALTDLEEKSAAVRGAAEAAQRAIAGLQGAAGD
jgi:chromosome segregation ATPase